jgi:hypothetical protein
LKIFLIFFQFNFVASKTTHKTYLLMIKKLLCFGLMTFSSTSLFAQLIELKPSDLQLPRVAALPSCAVADYGKMVFLTTTNRANVCSAGGWVVIETPTTTFPITNSGSYSGYMMNLINSNSGLNAGGIYISNNSLGSGLYVQANPTAPSGNNSGVSGLNFSTNANGYGVQGEHSGTGKGIYGSSNAGSGVYGRTTTGFAVYGDATGASGIAGYFGTSNATGIAGRFVTTQGSTGRAIHATGPIRFEGISEGVGKILVSDATGLATWQNLTRSDVRSISAIEFTPNRSDHVVLQSLSGANFSSLGAGQSVGVLFAPINLPNGSTITSVKFNYLDNNTSGAILTCDLLAVTPTGGAGAYNILTTSSTDSPSGQSITISPNLIINNTLNSYRIQVNMNAGTNLLVRGVEVTYTYPVN